MEEVTRLVSAGDCLKIWDAASMTTVEQFNPHSTSHPIAQACWSSNNQYLVSASSIGDKLVLSSVEASPIPVLTLAEGRKQTRVCLNSTSQYLVSGGLDNTVNIWDLKSKRLHSSLKDHKEEVTCVCFNASDSYASGSTSGDIILHSLTTNLTSKPFGHGTDQPIHDLRYSLVKRLLLGSVSDSGAVVLWDANKQKELHVFNGAHRAPASSLAFSPVNNLLFVTVGLDKKIVCYDTSSKIILRSMQVESPLTAVDFTPDGAGLVVGSTKGHLYLYDLRNHETPVKTVSAHKTSVTCVRFQSSAPRLRSNKLASRKSSVTQPNKRVSVRLVSPQEVPPTPTSNQQPGDGADGQAKTNEVVWREGEGLHGSSRLPSLDKMSSVGRNSMDIFSPVRDDFRTHHCGADVPTNGNDKDALSCEAEGQQSYEVLVGRGSMDIFSPVSVLRQHLGGPAQRWTPIGTPGNRSTTPCSVFETPPSIQEEPADTQVESSGTQQGSQALTTPPGTQNSHSHSAAMFSFQPSDDHRQAHDVPSQLSLSSAVNGYLPSAAQQGSCVSAVTSALSERIAQGVSEPFTSHQFNMIQETLEDIRDACHKDIINLHMEMIRQLCIQMNEFRGLVEHHSVNMSLVEENQRLREEIKQLRSNH